jgi:hypothetical protein
MRTEYVFVRYEGEDDDVKQIQCGRDEATCTIFIFTDVMPDGEEYGVSVQMTEVLDELPEPYLKTVRQSLDKYRKEQE